MPAAFRHVVEEFPGNTPTFTSVVEGSARQLHPAILEESYSIGREAIINALTHSGCLHIEIEIIYDPRQFRLRIRDDGRGIDPTILENGRADHWDLHGMREREIDLNPAIGIRTAVILYEGSVPTNIGQPVEALAVWRSPQDVALS